MNMDFPGGQVVKNPPAKAGDMGSIPDQEYPTCCRATKPMHHNYWSPCPRAHAPQQEKPLQ